MNMRYTEEEHVQMLNILETASKEILKGISELSKGYLPQELFPDHRLKKMIKEVRHMVKKEHPDYDLAEDRITHYRDMRLVTFLVDRETHSLVVSFPVFIQNYKRKYSLPLYEIENTYVPIPDKNLKANSFTKVRIHKPYIAANSDHYIQMKTTEMLMCKSIRRIFYCEEMFVVKHRSHSSCESSIFYKDSPDNIDKVCLFDFIYNFTAPPVIFDGDDEILLANFEGPRWLKCVNDNAGLAQPLPSHTYAVVPRSFLCHCHLEMEHTSVMRQLSACASNSSNEISFKFVVNMAFREGLKRRFPKIANKVKPKVDRREQRFDININPESSVSYLSRPKELDVILDKIQKSMEDIGISKTALPKISQHLNRILTIIASICSLSLLLIVGILIFKHVKLRTLVTGLVMSKAPIAQCGAVKEKVICTDPTLTTFATVITILGVIFWIYANCKHLSWLKGYRYSRTCTLFIFLCNEHYYVPIKLRKLSGHMNMYNLYNGLTSDQITLVRNYVWDILEFDWSFMTMKMNGAKISMPSSTAVPIADKIRVRRILSKDDLTIQFMIRQGSNWYCLQDKCAVAA